VTRVASWLAEYGVRSTASLLPVVVFLLSLMILDSYKLVRIQRLFIALFAGATAAIISLPLNHVLLDLLPFDPAMTRGYAAPLLEEALKGASVVFLIRRHRVGFLVDSAVLAFAVGTGFALIENLYYVSVIDNASTWTWIIRGFGTAIMHGGSTTLLAIISKSIYDHYKIPYLLWAVPGFLVATGMHSLYNHFFLSPILTVLLLLIVLPSLIGLVFSYSEHATRRWLGRQFDVEQELLEIIHSGQVTQSRLGDYFRNFQERFDPETVVDMICYLRLHLELAMSAKGILLMREVGFHPEPRPEIRESFEELRHLETTIGPAGRLAVMPLLHTSARDLWQLHMLEEQ